MEPSFQLAEEIEAVSDTFADEDASEPSVVAAVALVRAGLAPLEGAADVRAEFEYWAGAFAAAQAAATRDALKACVRLYLCAGSPHPHGAPSYNVSQGMMKATVHLVWRKLHAFEADQRACAGARAGAGAGRLLLQAMCAEIAAEAGETLGEMERRLRGGPVSP